MFSSDSSWRDRYYAADLDEVLSIFYESHKKHPLVNTLVGEENQSETNFSLDGQPYELPISMRSGQIWNSTDSPASPLTFPTFLGPPYPEDSPARPLTFSTSLGPPDSEDYNTALAPNRTFSSSPVELPSSASNTSLSCSICDNSFRSKSDEDQRCGTSLRSQVVRCSEPGCDKTFRRSDRMFRHCRKDHSIVLNPRSSLLI